MTTSPLDVQLVAGGLAALALCFLYLLRRDRPPVEVTPAGLVIGRVRAIPWGDIFGLGFVRRGREGLFVVDTARGTVVFESAQAREVPPPELKARIIDGARLTRAEYREKPRGRRPGLRVGETFEEWRPSPEDIPVAELAAGEAAAGAAPPPYAPGGSRPRRGPSARTLGAMLITLLLVLLKYGKILLFGLGKFGLVAVQALKLGKFFGTAVTMFGTIWIYALALGWPFAAGFVLLIFIHEMGHAVVLWRKGVRTGAPIFIPFVGALISLKEQPRDAKMEAEMAYGGPAAGTAGGLVSYALYLGTRSPLFLGLANVTFLMNLFNLLPMSPLDGGRIVGALSPALWLVGLPLVAALLVVTGSPMLLLVLIFGAMQAWSVWRRRAQLAAYFDVPARDRWIIGLAYFALAGFLGYLFVHTHTAIEPLFRDRG